jgi:hypothetical protein
VINVNKEELSILSFVVTVIGCIFFAFTIHSGFFSAVLNGVIASTITGFSYLLMDAAMPSYKPSRRIKNRLRK